MAQAARWENPTVDVAGRARAERTLNIISMVVTLEVSKLSGWLNALASCRESKGGHAVRGEVRAGGGGRSRFTQRAGAGSTADWDRARGGAHVEHAVHGCEAGGARCGPGGGRRRVIAGRPRCKQGAGERARLQIRGRPRGGTRPEHVGHGCDAGGVEAQRLVERIRVLPSRRGGIRCGARGGPGGERAWREDGASDMHTGRVQLKWHAYAERTVNMALISVTLDVSKLSGWLNAYADCRVERRACEAGRGESREAGGSEAAAAQAACTARGHARSAPGTCDTWS